MGVRDLLASVPVGKLRLDISGTNITTAAWAEISSSIPASCTAITVAYTGDGILKLAKGAAAAEVELPMYLTPGMNSGLIPLELTKAWRLSARAVDQNVTSGELVINLFG